MQMAAEGANSAVGYLFSADKLMVKHLAESSIKLTQNAVRRGEVSGYIDSLGMGSVKFWSVNKNITHRQLGIKIIPRPSQAEWVEFYQRISGMAEKGIISTTDLIVMQEMTNLRQARQYMAMIERRRKREASAAQKQNMEEQAMLNQQSVESAMQRDTQKVQQEALLKTSVIDKEREKELELLHVKYGYEIQLKEMDITLKRQNAETQARAKMLDTAIKKEGDMSIAREKIQNKQPQSS
jgi:hypothetical protein